MDINENDTELINDIVSIKKEPTTEELDNFKNLVNEWFKYDDQIRKLIIATKERKKHLNALNVQIQEFMISYNYNDLNTQQGRIKSNVKNVKLPVKMMDVKDKILKYKHLSGEELLNQIFNEERETIVKKNIRRIIPKVSLTL